MKKIQTATNAFISMFKALKTGERITGAALGASVTSAVSVAALITSVYTH
jgi:hypothetical protein